jgi:hypothetical protein
MNAGPSYSEVRDWAYWLQHFTARDLADAMGVDQTIGERGVLALLHQGICTNGGYTRSGESVISYVPLPPGPSEHPTEAPEWRTCDTEILSPRGMPVRIRSDRDTRRKLAGNMSARRHLIMQERRYFAMVDAQQARAVKNKGKIPKWMRKRAAI